jgi:hypothetical protein
MMREPTGLDSRSDESSEPNPYLLPVSTGWARAVGIVLLIAAAVLAVLLGYVLIAPILHTEAREPITSSTLIFLLMLVAALGFSAQAGWRLAVSRAHRPGSLFSWPTWLALAALVFTLTAIVATLRMTAGALTERDLQVILFGGGLGGWCLWLAWRSSRRVG